MLKKKSLHRDMADVNGYTAKRLKDMSASLGGLAQAFADEINGERQLTRDDGLAALQTAAAVVCGECSKCNLYSTSEKEDSYYLHYLLRAFEEKGRIEPEDMPRLFHETCGKQEDYMGQLNRNLGRATMNLAWKNRFLESRDAVIVQFKELASILDEFSHQMESASDITAQWEDEIRFLFRKHHLKIQNILIMEYENEQKEAFLTMRCSNGRCMTTKDASTLIGRAMGSRRWSAAKDSKSIITPNTATFQFIEEGKYRMLHGVAKVTRKGEYISGDNFTFREGLPRQVIMSLADGMGSGPAAYEDSSKVIELTEQLLETGFSARAALKLVNTVLLLAGVEQNPTTLDLCCIDLYTGVLEAMKLGAVAAFILGNDGVEILEAGAAPMGIVNSVEPVLITKKLWDNDRIVMVTDGVLEALPGENKEQVLQDYLSQIQIRNPQDMADTIMEFACSFNEEAGDDMTVLVGGIFER